MREAENVLVSANEVAITLNVRKGRVYDLAREGILPSVRLGRQIRFSRRAIDEWVARGGQPLSGPGGWRNPPEPTATGPPE